MKFRDMFKKTTYIRVEMNHDVHNKQANQIIEKNNNRIIEKNELEEEKEPTIPKGMWTKCNHCGEMIYTEDLMGNFYICPKCNGYFRIDATTRICMITDKDSFEEWDRGLGLTNPLQFPDYEKKLEDLKEKTELDEAIIIGKATIQGKQVVIGVMDTRFLMASMGEVVGEKITRAVERATKEKLPIILFTCSGGARMQEGIVSLMQMAKTSLALKRHSEAGLFYISVLTDPTTGGVTASFAMLGDVILAEPNALIGFAGPRVIEQTIGQKLPKGFQRSEFLLEHGLIDNVIKRENLVDTLAHLLRVYDCEHEKNERSKLEKTIQIEELEKLKKELKQSTKLSSAWDKVQVARSMERPTSLDYIETIFDDFYELHGDRAYRDDTAIVGGVAFYKGIPVTVIGQQKGKNTKENMKRNFGMPYPEGYRKALRLMKQAEKFNRPIICFVDTPGAFCGIEAEERGQGEAIARNLFEMAGITVPILSVVIGEGGSGGALAMAVADEVWILENSTYSILSPEGFASILWKDSKRAKEASEIMKITADDLKQLGIVETIISEHGIADETTFPIIAKEMQQKIGEFIITYCEKTKEELVEHRYERFRVM